MRSQATLGGAIRAVALGTALAMGTVTVAPPAFAQSRHQLAKARAAYRQGVSLEAAGDWAGALAKFEQVAKVKITPQVHFHIARCKENLGRLNEALGDYRMAEYEAKQKKAKQLKQITKARKALEERIPKLVITLGSGAEAAQVELDGVELGEAKLGNEVSVDPGSHHIVVTLSNDRQFDKDVTVKEGETQKVELVPPADLLKSPEPETPSPAELPPEETPKKKPAEKHHSVAPWIIGGIGVASLAASGVFYVLRAGAKSDLEKKCRGNICPSNLKSTGDKGKLYTTLSEVTLGVGAAGVVTAVILLAAGGSSSPKTDKKDTAFVRGVHVDVVQTSSLTGVNVVGSF